MSEEDIFHEALARAPADRAAYLDRVCTDPAVRASVEALLRANVGASGFLASPVPEVTATLPVCTEQPGTVIGPYKLLEPIGEGGFGAVFLAEQTTPVRRRVALKVLKPGMDTRQVVARFEAERQALAIMDHPNIARVFDGGATSSGRPYFVMELVKGVPITEYCDQNHLTPRHRLELFVQVCQAVQHAHQKGIIHRDLKPSNVLVSRHDTAPVVKVIDFGVAKALGQELTDKTLFTGAAQMIGTPLYMSPEQAGMSDLDVDTRSDIYSLGVVLYELLTGTTPIIKERFKRAPCDEIRRIIREEEPPRPSTRLSTVAELPSIAAQRHTEPAKLARLVRGELDFIAMKALEKDRNRRYETANGFAADVQRFAGEAVHAVPPSTGYRLRKFARRNRPALVTAAVLAVALLASVGAVAGSVGWALSDRAARQAAVEKEAELALGEAERWAEQEKWPEALDAVKRGEGLLAGGDSALRDRLRELRKDLEMLIRLEDVWLLVTDLRSGWHEWDEVHDGYVKAFADYGIDVLNLPVEDAAARVRARDRLAIPLVIAIDVWSCTVSPKTSDKRTQLRAVAGAVDPDPWRRRVREALERKDGAALAELAGSPDLARQPRNSLMVLEHGLRHCGRPKQAIDVRRLTQRHHPGDFWANYWLAHELYWSPNPDRDDVVSFARAAVAIRPRTAAAHLLLALALQKKGKYDEALIYHDKAAELAPNNPYAHHDRGRTLYLQGKYDEAVVCFRKAIELWPENYHAYGFLGHTRLAQNKPDEALAAYCKAAELNPNGALGNTLRAQEKLDEAIAAYRKAIELDRNNASAHRNRLANAHVALAHALRDQKRWDEAIAECREAIRLQPDHADARYQLGHTLRMKGAVDDAIAVYRELVRLKLADTLARSFIATQLSERAWRLARSANPQPSETRRAVELASEAVELEPGSALCWYRLGGVRYRAGDWKGGIEAQRRSIDLDETSKGGGARQWFFLAMAHWQLGEKEKAREWYDRAVKWTDDHKPKDEELHHLRAEVSKLLELKEKKQTDRESVSQEASRARGSYRQASPTRPTPPGATVCAPRGPSSFYRRPQR